VSDRCLECGFEYDSVTPASAAELLRGFGARYEKPLTRFLPGEDGLALLRTRPGPWTWSALEYACHVRDVFDIYDERVRRVLTEDRPALESMQRDERPARDRYNEQEPATVVADLGVNADRLAGSFAAVDEEAWDRIGLQPSAGERDLRWMAGNVVHEGNHHLLDVGRVLRTVRGK